MTVEKKIEVNFDSIELDIINKFIGLQKQFKYEDLCTHLSCCDCPMEKICDANISDAYELQDMINESLDND